MYKSTCSYCGVGCGVIIDKLGNDTLNIKGDPDYPVNKGMLCSKGMNLHYTVMDKSDRLLYPEMRWSRHSSRVRVSWDQALERAAAVFKTFIKKYGPDSVGFYVSGQCLTEEYYIINKLIKGYIGSNNIDTNSRLCMSSAVSAYKMALGEDAVPLSYEDIELADCFFITGANPAWCHPILFRRLEAYKAANPEVKIIVADPRKTQTCSIADMHLAINPGTDIVLNQAIAHYLIEQNYIDPDFIANHTQGYEAFRAEVMKRTIDEAAAICDVNVEDIIQAAEWIGKSKGFISLWAMGLNQSVVGVNKNLSLINLSLITGKIGKPGNGPFSLTGQPNAMGGREVGGLSTMLAAHRNLDNPVHRKEVADFWGVEEVPSKPGYTATEMIDALFDGRMKAVWIICTNPLVSLPDSRKVEAALRNARFVVVQDISSRSDTIQFADLVLPAAGYMEKEGTMTNSERRVSYLAKVIDAPGEALPDAEIIWKFAQKMGYENGFNYNSYEDIFKEHCQLTKGTNIDISGLSYDLLKAKRSVQWPYKEGASTDTKRLFSNKIFYSTSTKAIIHKVSDLNNSELCTPEYPLILTTGRIRDQWHTMTRTGKVMKLNQHIDKPFLEISPADAEARGIKDNDILEVTSLRGNVRVLAKVTDDIKRGVVFLPMHWGKLLNNDFTRSNNLTKSLVDPISKEPDFKFSAVQVCKYKKPKERIVVIGAGAAACKFISEYRALNNEDEITIFSKEKNIFYNRVMLPEYFSGKQHWQQLIKLTPEEIGQLNVCVYPGINILAVDPKNKVVVDAEGIEYPYDKLILATGSRSAAPRDINKLKGQFTIRYREDIEKLHAHLKEGEHVTIVGGGLLGLEMADALHLKGLDVTIVQRTSRLMDRQLDSIASDILVRQLEERGMKLFFNDEILRVGGAESVNSVVLKSGRRFNTSAIIYAIGTIPNIELAIKGGIKHNRGVVIDEYLQTSHNDIYAVGEIAEFKGMLYGITAAAEEQAEILAGFINGRTDRYYSGSLFMNILKVSGTSVSSLGMIAAPPNDPEYEEIVFLDKAKGFYKKCVIHRDRLVGAILVGDRSEFNEFRELIKQKIELADKRTALLGGSSVKVPVKGELVCSCNNVGKGNIEEEIAKGNITVEAIGKCTGAGTGCGSCKPEIKEIVKSCLTEKEYAKV